MVHWIIWETKYVWSRLCIHGGTAHGSFAPVCRRDVDSLVLHRTAGTVWSLREICFRRITYTRRTLSTMYILTIRTEVGETALYLSQESFGTYGLRRYCGQHQLRLWKLNKIQQQHVKVNSNPLYMRTMYVLQRLKNMDVNGQPYDSVKNTGA